MAGLGRVQSHDQQVTHTTNSDRLHHFQTSTFCIMSAKALPQRGSLSSIPVSLQPHTWAHSPREDDREEEDVQGTLISTAPPADEPP